MFSRSITIAKYDPDLAAAIAADILGLPQPLSQRLRTALHPNRAVIRAIVRQQPLL